MRLFFVAVVLVLSSCPMVPVPECNAASCEGCCDAKGDCQPGATATSCGSFGGACLACRSTETCSLGVCRDFRTGGGGGLASGGGSATGGGIASGGGSATGGGTASGGGSATGGGGASSCSSATCAGCCNGTVCELGTTSARCGTAGAACVTCNAGLTCQGGACRAPTPCGPTTCAGCCADGVCQAGTSQTQCGGQGMACIACGVGTGCQDNQCKPVTPSCGPSTCSGCCDAAGVCQSGTSLSACGSGGATCTTCATGQCTQGQCTQPSCGPGTCSGCCDGQGACQAGTSLGACGLSGQACTACTSAQACVAGSCLSASRPTGSPCTTSNQCAGAVDGLFVTDKCVHATSGGSPTGWVDGYCSPSCLSLVFNLCPGASDYCDGYSCYQPCSAPGTGQSTCRAGYVCLSERRSDGGVISGSAHCEPNCNNAGATCPFLRFCNAQGYCQ